ncbi:MAG: YidC/Oxa1 family membrane protein insertase, partial [Clostridia bacterium]|nr:YidC/Oxa1 family membrane protein insertase [Clostridia bacterium]
YILRFFASWFNGNFAAAVALFTLLINVIMIPLSIKSQKSSVQQMRIKPKLDELKKKYGDDRQKMAQAQQKLYQEEGVSMSGGCLPMIIRLLIMFSIYQLIYKPLTYLMNVDTSIINSAAETLKLKSSTAIELGIINNASKLTADKFNVIHEAIKKIDFNLFGIDLTKTPSFSFDFKNFELIWLIPIVAFVVQILTSLLSMAIQKKNNPEAPSMALMMLTMPLLTLFIGFKLPGGVGFYWICSSLIGGLIQAGVQIFYGPNKMLAKQRAKELKKQLEFEEKQISKYTASTINGEENG